eukprot:COSAG01_NODE_4903_length_4639_cov_3.876679_2_plen_387_part_00
MLYFSATRRPSQETQHLIMLITTMLLPNIFVAVLATFAEAVPKKPLTLHVKTEHHLHGSFDHQFGRTEFKSTPSNLTVDSYYSDQGGKVELLSISAHCVPDTECATSYKIFTACKTRLLMLNSKLYHVPLGVNTRHLPSIEKLFAAGTSDLTETADAETQVDINQCYKDFQHHLGAPLQSIYDTMYNEYEVTGLSHESAIPLYLTAMALSSAGLDGVTPDPNIKHVPVVTDHTTDGTDASYHAFREAMVTKSQRRSLQRFSTNSNINFCMSRGYVNRGDYTFAAKGSKNDWSTCCGRICGDVRDNKCKGTCGSYKPDCGNSCLGMCGPSCSTCWPGICGDCCKWKGCYQHDQDCNSFISSSCIGRTVQAVWQQASHYGQRKWCLNG